RRVAGEAGGGGAGQAAGGGADGVGAGGVQHRVVERGHAGHGGRAGGAAAAEAARAVGADRHRGRAARQVVERVQDLHGDGGADGHAGRRVRRLHAEGQVVRRRRAHLEAVRGGAAQAGGAGADGVAAGGVQRQVAEGGHATHSRHAGGAAAAERAGAVGADRHRRRAARQVVERVQALHGDGGAGRDTGWGGAPVHAETPGVIRGGGHPEGVWGGAAPGPRGGALGGGARGVGSPGAV